MKVLFVCTGNLYRSQAAAAIGKALGLQTDSAGVMRRGFGKRVPGRLREALERMGYAIPEEARSSGIEAGQVAWADSIVYMIPNHLIRLQELFPEVKPRKFSSLGTFTLPPVERIPDPMCLKGKPFNSVLRLIEEAVGNLKRWS